MLPKTPGSAQTHKSVSFIWIVWSTLYAYLWFLHVCYSSPTPGSQLFYNISFLIHSIIGPNCKIMVIKNVITYLLIQISCSNRLELLKYDRSLDFFGRLRSIEWHRNTYEIMNEKYIRMKIHNKYLRTHKKGFLSAFSINTYV